MTLFELLNDQTRSDKTAVVFKDRAVSYKELSECTRLEMRILDGLTAETSKKIFVDTNIPVETLREISDAEHVLIMLAEPRISVERFFERPDREKQFLYQLLLKEKDPEAAIANFRACIERVNTPETYRAYENCGFNVLKRDDRRTVDETFALVRSMFRL